MSVIVELTLPAQEFELGQILHMEGDTSIILETMVPLGDRSIPFFTLHDGQTDFKATVRDHPTVADIHEVNTHDGETLYALDWQITADSFFQGIQATDAHILDATGSAQTWAFELRFPSHDALSDF